MEEIQLSRLKEARLLLDEGKYEQAIKTFQGLLGTEYDTEAQKGIQEAQDRYAEQQRRKAADLVYMALGKEDAEERKRLLIQALTLLQEVNMRYPANRYARKIQRNIGDVIARIQKMDPLFTPSPPQVSSEVGQQEDEQSQ
jgi:thioredoxin-like negative regulator of GroEL